MNCPKCGSYAADGSRFCPSCGQELEKVAAQKGNAVVQTKHKKLGLFFIIGPFVLIFFTLIAHAITTFTMANAGPNNTLVSAINVVFSLLGLVGVIAILIGVPFGIVLMNKKTVSNADAYDKRSGRGDQSEIPPEIKGWSWGAAGLTWIWGAYHRVWIAFLQFIPIINIIWWIVLGIKGREWAWRKEKWTSVDAFLASQKKWDRWGLAFFILGILLLALSIFID